MGFDLVPPDVTGALVAAVAALVMAGLASLPGCSGLAGAAAGVGLAIGFAAVLDVQLASPRQLAERLPLLAIIGVAAGFVAMRGPVSAVSASLLGVLGAAWWMAGAPVHGEDLERAAPVALALLAGMALAVWRGRDTAALATAWAALAAGLFAAGPPGPALALGLAGLGALAGGAVGRAAPGIASRLTLSLALAGVAAVPVVARGAPPDLAIAAAAGLPLLFGPPLRAVLPEGGGRWLGPVVAALPALVLAYLWR